MSDHLAATLTRSGDSNWTLAWDGDQIAIQADTLEQAQTWARFWVAYPDWRREVRGWTYGPDRWIGRVYEASPSEDGLRPGWYWQCLAKIRDPEPGPDPFRSWES